MAGLPLQPRLKHSKCCSDKETAGVANFDQPIAFSNCEELQLKDFVKPGSKQFPRTEFRSSLKQEIMLLEKKLQGQFETRHALEQALGCRSSSYNTMNDVLVPKSAMELIKEIALLEFEVVYLEQHLLALYQRAFELQMHPLSPITKRNGPEISKLNCNLLAEKPREESSQFQGVDAKSLDSDVHRCHSLLSQHSTHSNRSPPAASFTKAVLACHSHPLSMIKFAQGASSPSVISLAEHLGTRVSDHVPLTPSRLSEDMIKCMSTIYCKLAEPPSTNHNLASPSSSSSSINAFSSQDLLDLWSLTSKKYPSFDFRLDNPFHVQGLRDFCGPYSTMVEVQRIHRDGRRSGHIEHLLQDFSSLLHQLEKVNPNKLKHEERLAFWINIHNALAMHTYLAHGIPQNNLKRVFLSLKAAYNIGGQTVSADTIKSSILGCRTPCPRPWFQLFLSSRAMFKSGGGQQIYMIERPEPLLRFGLCSGFHSDPAVRVYTPKTVVRELEVAREDYVRANIAVHSKQKILLPKLVESFAKDLRLCQGDVMDMLRRSLPESPLRKIVEKLQPVDRSSKSVIQWVPHNFRFRYLISKESLKW